ncbi:unnamed protein product [Linum tenue]|uniref:Uncharacterized protein n=1 Tax=Linum tenue TaxID=586396 RepID=A0AAV0S6T7_9ROSI|nr:unnamed protein product [Linum tenue]
MGREMGLRNLGSHLCFLCSISKRRVDFGARLLYAVILTIWSPQTLPKWG